MAHDTRSLLLSLGFIGAGLALAYIPIPGGQQTIIVVSGSELQEPLDQLELRFEQEYPNIDVDLKFQGSRDIINNYLDDNNAFVPTVLIPANGELLGELRDRWTSQDGSAAFDGEPQAIAKTMLVAVTWPERGNTLFPNGKFQWERLETALDSGSWDSFGNASWGSFDLVITDPTRSNSGQLALSLWSQSKLGSNALTPAQLNQSNIQDLVDLVKRSVYQPPRSTDILLQEFIARGPNDADIALVYESIALHRWEQSSASHTNPYQVYYLDPTIETISTAAIASRDVDRQTIEAAQTFLDFLAQPEQQETFVQFGFRPIDSIISLDAVPDSPWAQNIPGASVDPPITAATTPDQQTLSEIIRLWQRAD
ncbi:MAG: substrate-binding domain-containing protein [Elainellaceae cyanobacterium]